MALQSITALRLISTIDLLSFYSNKVICIWNYNRINKLVICINRLIDLYFLSDIAIIMVIAKTKK